MSRCYLPCCLLVAGGGNIPFVRHFYNRVDDFTERGFLWNMENKDHRNARSIVAQGGSNREIWNMCEDLARKNILSIQIFPKDEARPDREGGTSSALSRHRARSQPSIQTRGGINWERRAVPCVGNANQPPPCVGNANQPAGGGSSSGSNDQPAVVVKRSMR